MNNRDWVEYQADGNGYIPVEKWGKDHWSTFAYLETVTVDKGNIVGNRQMRTNPRLHRELVGISPASGLPIDGSYPTRLKGGEQAENHDDWSCIEDMVNAGIVVASFRVKDGRTLIGNSECRVRLTSEGEVIAHQLRDFKRNGGNFADFQPTNTMAVV